MEFLETKNQSGAAGLRQMAETGEGGGDPEWIESSSRSAAEKSSSA